MKAYIDILPSLKEGDSISMTLIQAPNSTNNKSNQNKPITREGLKNLLKKLKNQAIGQGLKTLTFPKLPT